jgi:uncharacterized membrane protein YfcA
MKHARLGNVDFLMALGLSGGTFLASYGCSNVAIRMPDHVLEAAFTVGMLVLGNRTLKGLKR